jgi:hypothetical protein
MKSNKSNFIKSRALLRVIASLAVLSTSVTLINPASASASANGSFAISQANGSEVIESVALRWARRDATQPELVKVGSIIASGSYALATWVYGETGGQVLLRRENGQWRVVTGGGGSLENVDYLMQLGVPQKDAETLADGADV